MAKDALVKSSIKTNTSNQTPLQLLKEADDLSSKSIEALDLSKTKTGPEKDKLLTDYKDLKNQANNKSLQAAELTKNDNKATFDTNKENIQTLISENKSNQADNNEAKKLNDEANIAYTQSKTIREEALSQPNIGSKLGGLSNAEEKEAEALNKQKQAVDLLKKSNQTTNLKTAITSVSTANNTSNITQTDNQEALTQKLNDVNKTIETLVDTKLAAYQKLYEANKLELEQANTTLKTNETTLNATPTFKSEFIAANSKMASAETLKQNSDNDQNKNDKLNNLINATKKQIEAINQLNKLNKKVEAQLAKNSNTNNTQVTNNTSQANNTNTQATNNNTAQTNNNTQTTNNTQTANNTQTVNNNTQTTNSTANTANIDVNTLAKTDTTAAQVLNYFENKKITNSNLIKNKQANTFITTSLNNLKKIEEETKQLQNNTSQTTNTVTPTQLKTKADELAQQAEELSVKAFDTRAEANAKTEPEKDDLLNKAKQYDNQSNDKKLEASNYTQQSNDVNYTSNSAAITELLTKLKTDNPTLATELEQKNADLTAIKKEATELRTEANAQTNTSSKIGGLGNAEEKEAELLQKQNTILNQLKNTYPDYVVKIQGPTTTNLTPEEITQKQNQLKEKQNDELTNLTNGFSLEYETNKTGVPNNLNPKQTAVKQNADDLNAESKRLLIKASQETNPNEKIKLLTLAAKTGNAAVEQLNTITKTKAIATNNANPRNNQTTNNTTNPRNNQTTNNNTQTANNTTIPRNNATTNNATTSGKGTVKVEGLEVIAGNAYNANRPIPLDSKIPDGLLFRVQIGAFKTQLQNDAFKGLSPLSGETVGNGYIRYTAGNFNKLENASAVKNDLRNLGYNDAFVVVYYNGKRIPLNEALALLEKEGKTLDTNAPQTAGITANSNVPRANTVTQTQNPNAQNAVTVTKELEQLKNMLFTVQIGVYSKQVTKQQLQNLKPIYTERLANGLFRYTAGIYNNSNKIITDKRQVVNLGIKDAFISAYLNGKRIDFNDAKNRQQSDTSIKMETENPIIFSDAIPRNDNVTQSGVDAINSNTIASNNVQPFKNNVTNYPAATPENGVKPNEEGVSFKVQIGAYSKQVPNDAAAKFSAIKNWPIENKQINALFIYNVGNFTEAKFAKDLKEEAIRLGITDAFISVYRDGKKLFGADASALLSK